MADNSRKDEEMPYYEADKRRKIEPIDKEEKNALQRTSSKAALASINDTPSSSSLPVSNRQSSDQSQDENVLYSSKNGGKPAFGGYDYQIYVLKLILMKAKIKPYDMRLGTEVDDAAGLDDVVFKYFANGKWFGVYGQIKRRENEKINEKGLITKKGLCLYYKIFLAFCKLERNRSERGRKNDATRQPDVDTKSIELKNCFLLTNTEFHDNFEMNDLFEKEKWDNSSAENVIDDILYDNSTNFKAEKYKVKGEILKNSIMTYFRADSANPKFELRGVNQQTIIAYIEEFAKKFRLIIKFPEIYGIDQIISNELKKYLKLNVVDLANNSLTKCMLEWFRDYAEGQEAPKKSNFISCEFLNEIIRNVESGIYRLTISEMNKIYMDRLVDYKINFVQNLKILDDFLSNKGKLKDKNFLYIHTQCSRLSSLKVIRTLESEEFIEKYKYLENDDGKIFMIIEEATPQTIERVITQYKEFASSPKKGDVIPWIIECHFKEKDKITKLHNGLNRIKHKAKKIILIAAEKSDINEETTESYDVSTKFEDLDDASQNKVLSSTVIVQFQPVSLNQIINKERAKSVIDEGILLKLLEKKEIKIGNMSSFSSIGYNKECYVDRTFHHKSDNSTELEEEYFTKPENLERKVVIVANDPGVGKSTVLTSIALNMKKEFPAMWIVRINLRDYFDSRKEMSLKKIEFTREESEPKEKVTEAFAIEFLSQMAVPNDKNDSSIKFQRELFKSGLLNGICKIVIFFDGFDEIAPNLESQTTGLIKALAQTKVTQIWVTTRIHEQKNVEEKLQGHTFILNSLTIEKQKIFLCKYWKYQFMYKRDEDGEKECKRSFEEIRVLLASVESTLNSLGDPSAVIRDLVGTISETLKISDPKSLEEDINGLNLDTYGEELLEKWNSSVGDNERKFTDAPLYLQMLAEVIFQKKFQPFQNLGLIHLYDEFVNITIGTFRKKYDLLSAGGFDTLEESKESWLEMCRTFALNNYLDRRNLNRKIIEQDKEEKKINRILRSGLMIKKDDQLDFIHPSFEEYFLSEYFILNLNNEQVQQILFEKVLKNRSGVFLRKLLNDQIQKKAETKELIPIQLNMNVVEESTIGGTNKYKRDAQCVLHRAAEENLPSLINFLLIKLKDDKKIFNKLLLATDRDGKTALFYAIFEKHGFSLTPLNPTTISKDVENTRKNVSAILQNIDDDDTFEDLIILTIYGGFVICRHNFVELQNAAKDDNKLCKRINDLKNGFDFDKVEDQIKLLNNAIDDQDEDELEKVLNLEYLGVDEGEVTRPQAYIKAMVLASVENGFTSLHRAISKGNSRIVAKLLKHVEKFPRILEELVLKVCFYRSVRPNDFLLILPCYDAGHTAITLAAEKKHVEILEALLKNVKNDMLEAMVLKRGHYGATVLHSAFEMKDIYTRKTLESCDKILENHKRLVETLLEYMKKLGKDVLEHMVSTRDYGGRPVISIIFLMLESYSKIGNSTETTEPFLVFLSNIFDDDIFKKLVQATSLWGKNCLHYCFRYFDPSFAKKIFIFLGNSLERDMFNELVLAEVYILYRGEDESEKKLNFLKYLQSYLGDQYVSILYELLFRFHDNGDTILHHVLSHAWVSWAFDPEPVLVWMEGNLDQDTMHQLLLAINKDGRTALDSAITELRCYSRLKGKYNEIALSMIEPETKIEKLSNEQIQWLQKYVERSSDFEGPILEKIRSNLNERTRIIRGDKTYYHTQLVRNPEWLRGN